MNKVTVTIHCPVCRNREAQVTVPAAEQRQAEQFGEGPDGEPGALQCDACIEEFDSPTKMRQREREVELGLREDPAEELAARLKDAWQDLVLHGTTEITLSFDTMKIQKHVNYYVSLNKRVSGFVTPPEPKIESHKTEPQTKRKPPIAVQDWRGRGKQKARRA